MEENIVQVSSKVFKVLVSESTYVIYDQGKRLDESILKMVNGAAKIEQTNTWLKGLVMQSKSGSLNRGVHR